MDIQTNLHSEPLRRRTQSTQEFNQIPGHVYPKNTSRLEGEVAIAGVKVTDIVKEYGTPAFVMDEDDFRTRCRLLAEAFGGGHHVHYASKAFLSREVARWVADEGLSLDVASEGELAVALAAGFPADRITVHGNNKSLSFLTMAVEARVELIVVDSLQEIENLSAVVTSLSSVPVLSEQDVLVRVTPGVHVDTHEFIATSHEDQKFGFSLASGRAYEAALRCIHAPGVRLRGLHAHVGSQVFEADGFALAAERLLGLWKDLLSDATVAPHASSLDVLDLGGGYGIAYTPDQEALDVKTVAQDLRSKVAAAARELDVPMPVLNVEPGRAIAGPTMVTIYTVGTVKDVDTSDKMTRRYISVDGGMSDNIRPVLYQAEYDCRLANREAQGELIPTRVVGSHCESGDVLLNDALLPNDIVPGDILMFGATGAYCYSMTSRYNMLSRPPVVVVRDSAARLMLRRETVEDFLALEPEN